MGKQSRQPDQDQIDRDQVVEQPGQDQDQNSEQQRHQGLQHDNIDMHEWSLSQIRASKSSRERANPDPVADLGSRGPGKWGFSGFLPRCGEKRKNR